MEWLVNQELTTTGVDIYQDGETLRAATPCCGFMWKNEGLEFECPCGKVRVKVYFHQQYIKLWAGSRAQVVGWVRHWTGIKEMEVEVEL